MEIKKIKVLSITTLTFFYSLCYAQEVTKSETEEWLNGKLTVESYTYIVNASGETFYFEGSYSVNIKNCDCKIDETFKRNGGNEKKSSWNFNFNMLTTAEVIDTWKGYTTTPEKVMHVKLTAYNSKDVISKSLDSTTEMESTLSLYVEADLAERAAKALQHYIKLCGGKKEKF